jgi:hypothetical protein
MVKGSDSKFFITLDKAEHLHQTATIFGKITGPTMFNVLRMGSMATDDNDCPEHPIKVNGVEVGGCSAEKPCKVAVDSGTSSITGPTKDIQRLKSTLDIHADCSNVEQLLPVEFFFESNDLSIGFYTLQLKPKRYMNSQQQTNFGSSTCSHSLMGLDVPSPRGPLWVLGDTFFEDYFVVFDRAQRTVSFAQLAEPPLLVEKRRESMVDLDHLLRGQKSKY